MGSEFLVRELVRDGVRVELMLSLDMVGYFTDEPDTQQSPIADLGLLYPERGNFLAVFGDADSRDTVGRVKRGLLALEDRRTR